MVLSSFCVWLIDGRKVTLRTSSDLSDVIAKMPVLSPNVLILIVGRCFTSRVHHQAKPSVLANASYIMSFSISLFHFNLGSKQGIITAD